MVEPTSTYHTIGKATFLFHFTPDLTESKLVKITKALPLFYHTEYFKSLSSSLLYLFSPSPTQLWQSVAFLAIAQLFQVLYG